MGPWPRTTVWRTGEAWSGDAWSCGLSVLLPLGVTSLAKIRAQAFHGLGNAFESEHRLGPECETTTSGGARTRRCLIRLKWQNTGKNFLVRAVSGIGSVLAEVAGNNTSGAFSEDDMLRERLAENVGTAGDSEVMNLNANSRVVVSVPADTKIYIVFTKHEQTPAELHAAAPTVQ